MIVASFFLLCCLGGANCFRICCKTPLAKPSATDLKSPQTIHMHRCRKIPLYHQSNGENNPEPTPIEDINALKTQKLTAVNQKTVLSAVSVIVVSAAIFGVWNLDISSLLEKFLLKIGSLGSLGYLYFAMVSQRSILPYAPCQIRIDNQTRISTESTGHNEYSICTVVDYKFAVLTHAVCFVRHHFTILSFISHLFFPSLLRSTL